jgi:hypothetical protein
MGVMKMIGITSGTTRTRSIFSLVSIFIVLAAALFGLSASDLKAADANVVAAGIGDWQKSASGGFGAGGDNMLAMPIVEYKGSLYTGVSNQNGAEVRVKQGAAWNTVSTSPGLGNVNNMGIVAMHVYRDKLYVGTMNYNDGFDIWEYDGTNWTKLVGSGAPLGAGFGSTTNVAAVCMEVHNDKLYVGTLNLDINSGTSNGGEVWSYNADGASWVKDAGGGFGNTANFGVTSLKEYNGKLYAGTLTASVSVAIVDWFTLTADVTLKSLGCQLWAQEVSGWQKVADNGFTRPDNVALISMEAYGGSLWLGTLSGNITLNVTLDLSSSYVTINSVSWSSKGLCIYTSNGATVTPKIEDGFESTNEVGAFSMATINAEGQDLLLVGAGRASGTGTNTEMTAIMRAYDGQKWYEAAPDGFGTGNMAVMSIAQSKIDGTLWAGTLNADDGCEIWSVLPIRPTEPLAVSTFYFAEGYTGAGFQEYICIGNPESEVATATITYMYKNATTSTEEVSIPANSRATINVNAQAGANQDVSAKIESGQKIIAERPMYFNYNGVWTGGHDVVGATSPAFQWYFAEGYTGAGFDEWVCVMNPGDTQANLAFHFQTQEAGEQKIEGRSVPPHSRASFKANDLLGGKPYQTSLMLTSDQPIVAERPMYFDYTGTGNWHWTGGHCVMGTPVLEKEYYFAEGTTRAGFEEWLTLQNPNAEAISVDATYQVGPGQGSPIQKSYSVPAQGRTTIYVPGDDAAGREKDVSVRLSSLSFFLAERPMYFRYSYNGLNATGGHCVIGAPASASDWFLAEGYTGSGFNEWLCIQNPNDSASTVEITYYTQEKGALPANTETVPAKTRMTLMVNQHAGAGYQLSTRVRVTSGLNVVVERPMYFICNGWDGGHDVVGYVP